MFIMEDEGFSIPSEKAANARVCARALLQWTRDNEKPAEEFSGKLVASLKACFHKSKSVRVQEEKFCEKLFKFLSSAAYRDSWKTFLGSSIQKKACPTFYQAVTDHMMEKLSKTYFSVETPAPTPPPPPPVHHHSRGQPGSWCL